MNKTRIAIASVVSLYFLYYCLTYHAWHFIDNVNLIIHEAGHVVFMPFGSFVHTLGGSLFQILVPLLFAFYFYRRMEYFSASLLLFWVAQSTINVSVYASDAIAMQLPLLGGDGVVHDWNSILNSLGLLRHAEGIGSALFLLGIFVGVCAVYLSFTNTGEKKVYTTSI